MTNWPIKKKNWGRLWPAIWGKRPSWRNSWLFSNKSSICKTSSILTLKVTSNRKRIRTPRRITRSKNSLSLLKNSEKNPKVWEGNWKLHSSISKICNLSSLWPKRRQNNKTSLTRIIRSCWNRINSWETNWLRNNRNIISWRINASRLKNNSQEYQNNPP